jgi:hypothetical protein
MAITEDQMVLLREWIQESVSTEWSDDRLDRLFVTAGGDLEATAAMCWRIKASSVAHLVDVSENGSSRKLGEVYGRYIKIAEDFESQISERITIHTGRPYTNAIVRP